MTTDEIKLLFFLFLVLLFSFSCAVIILYIVAPIKTFCWRHMSHCPYPSEVKADLNRPIHLRGRLRLVYSQGKAMTRPWTFFKKL